MHTTEDKQPLKRKIPEEIREQLIAAIDAEIKGEFVQRHKQTEIALKQAQRVRSR